MRPRRPLDQFITNQIDLAAAIVVTTSLSPQVMPGTQMVEFVFPPTDAALRAAADFAAGTLQVRARDFVNSRARLWRRMREAMEAGGER